MLNDVALDYYADIGAALFPIPFGKKAPWGIVGSFKDDHSHDPEQWKKWRSENENCNFGVVAFASRLIICDTDIKPTAGQSADEARAEAWSMRSELFKSWGMNPDTLPHTQSAHGGWHDMFTIPSHIDATTLRQPDAIKGRINVRVVGYTVAAGSYYDGTEKNDAPGHYQLFDNAPPPHPAPAALIEHCSPAKPRENVAKIGSHDRGDVGALVTWLNDKDHFADHETWVNLGMALRLEYGDSGLDLWRLSHDDTVTENVEAAKWKSFDKEPSTNSVTLNTFMKDAHAIGWTGSIRPSIETQFKGAAEWAAIDAARAAGKSSAVEQPAQSLPTGTPGPSNPATEENEANELAHPTPAGGFLKSLTQFLNDHVPPYFIVKGILQKRYCYSLTAQTGTGKTAVAMRIAAHVATGRPLGNIKVKKGQVIYFAGENPSDVRARWLGLCKEMNLDPDTTDVIIFEGAAHISKVADRIGNEMIEKGLSPSLIIVDTSAAYFETDDENDTIQALEHARRMRSLCQLPGEPCVLVLCHPTKNAKDGELIPRGGGAFLNEVDGNIALYKGDDGKTVGAQALGKFRGAPFDPLHFALKTITDHPLLVDADGDPTPTVVAELISDAEMERRDEKASTDEDKVLQKLCDSVGMKNSDVGKVMGDWHREKTRRILSRLADQGLASATKDIWTATSKGQKYLNAAASAQPVQGLAPLTPANLGPAAFPTPVRPGAMPPMPPVPV